MTTSAAGSSSMVNCVRRAVRNPSSRASCSTSLKRSGCRGAMTSSARGASARIRSNAFSTTSSSPRMVDPRHHHGAIRGHVEEAQHAGSGAVRAGRGARRLNRVELQVARDADPRRVGAEVDQPLGRLARLHAEAVDVRQHPLEQRPDEAVARVGAGRDPPVDHGRLHAGARGTPRSRFGQISVSTMMNSRGFTSRSVRRTMNGKSRGK